MQLKRTKTMRWVQVLLLILLSGAVPVLYNSCSSEHSGNTLGSSSLSKSNGCSLEAYFERTYHPLLKENCANCHANGGSGSGIFADQNLDLAWESFELSGYSKVSSYAVNPAHNPPYTGDHLTQKVNELLLEWSIAEQERFAD
jgi:hypothetical protein